MGVRGERKVWLAYLLWLTIFGHRWYLGKISPVYVLTLGYAGIMWVADLFRIPAMVRERNAYAYQRHLAYAAAGSGSGDLKDGGGIALGAGAAGNTGMAGADGGGEGPERAPQGVIVNGAVRPGTPGLAASPADSQKGGGPSFPPAESGPWWKKKPVIIGASALVLVLLIAAAAGGRGSGKGDEVVNAERTEPRKVEVTLSGATAQTVQVPSFTVSGMTEPDASVTIKGCAGSPARARADGDGCFSVPITLNDGLNLLTVTCEKDGVRGEASLTVTYQMDPAEYKAQCQPVEFRVLEKNPDALKGQKYYAMGEVVQIMEGSLQTDIRMDVTRDKWGYWSDTIYVTYGGMVPDAYEESIIEVWGEIQGSYTYTSTAGWKITLPLVKAKYIEVVKK